MAGMHATYLALSEAHVSNQEDLIAELDRNGHDTTEARNVLATLLKTKELHKCQRERALKAIGGGPMIGSQPLTGIDGDAVAAAVIGAIDQQPAQTNVAHLGERDLLRAG